MEITSTDIKNNFGKYLALCKREPIYITKNGRIVARLMDCEDTGEFSTYTSVAESSNAYDFMKGKLSYEDFMVMNESAKERYELIDGEVYLLASPRVEHQFAIGKLYMKFSNFFAGKPCQAFLSPFDITLLRQQNDDSKHVVQPDMVVICDLKDRLNGKGKYMGTPTVVVEILSPSTQRKDHITKLDLYRDSGVKEYWIANPETKEILIYTFEVYELANVRGYHKGDVAESTIYPGLQVTIDEVFM